MRDSAITLVFQGPWHPAYAANIAASRRAFPGARLVLSTWEDARGAVPAGLADELVFSPDPGALPPYKFGRGQPANNVNRQIASTRAGLARVATPFAAKLRTDCALRSRAALDAYQAWGEGRRLVVGSFYTLHPEGLEGFPYHVSDWFQFGRTEQLRDYWNVEPMTQDEARWFELQPHAAGSHYFARRYRSRLAPEQYVAAAYARRRGYPVPCAIDDRYAGLAEAYARFLARETVVQEPQLLGLSCPKYARLASSHYQFFNCVSGADWRALREGRFGAPGRRARAVALVRRFDAALPWMNKAGCMPLLGKCLSLYRD